MPKLEDITGNRYGRLTVIEFAGFHEQPSGRRRSQWRCRCDCGNEVIVQTFNLKSGNSKSCGCYNAESIKDRSTTHGCRHTRLYAIWTNMKTRCYNKGETSDYMNYGGRGIKMCEEWRDSFEPFRDWALKNGYDDSLSIDRVDVDGAYEPSNCRWVDAKLQANNRRNTISVSSNGETRTLSEWSRITGIKYHTIYARMKRLGMSQEEAINYSKNKHVK